MPSGRALPHRKRRYRRPWSQPNVMRDAATAEPYRFCLQAQRTWRQHARQNPVASSDVKIGRSARSDESGDHLAYLHLGGSAGDSGIPGGNRSQLILVVGFHNAEAP